jgi:hypothetical protein
MVVFESLIWWWFQANFVYIVAVVTSIRWVWEYSQSRKFEKNKFLLERYEKFSNLESTKKVEKLLDWNKITLNINNSEIIVDDSFLVESLKTHNQKAKFDFNEVYIREIFDEYFNGLTELIILSKTGLIDKKNLKKFTKYWVEIINGKNKNKPEVFVETINNYLEFYKFSEIIKFIK